MIRNIVKKSSGKCHDTGGYHVLELAQIYDKVDVFRNEIVHAHERRQICRQLAGFKLVTCQSYGDTFLLIQSDSSGDVCRARNPSNWSEINALVDSSGKSHRCTRRTIGCDLPQI